MNQLLKRELFDQIMNHLSEELKDPSEQNPEIEKRLLAFRFLPARDFLKEDHVVPTSMVKLKQLERNIEFWVLLVPSLGGWISTYEKKPLQILTVSSPLGAALLGKKEEDEFTLDTYTGEVRTFKILKHF